MTGPTFNEFYLPNSKDIFFDEYEKFCSELKASTELSSKLNGQLVEKRLGWITWIFARLCLNCTTMSIIIGQINNYQNGKEILDHYTLAGITRSVMETTITLAYISDEELSDDEWLFRKHIMDLHDLVARNRMLKNDFTDESEFKSIRNELLKRIRGNKLYQQLNKHQKKSIGGGRTFFLNGIKAAALKTGWDANQYDLWTTYLSQHIHSLPVSFYRMDQHSIDFNKISNFQYGFGASLLEICRKCLSAGIEAVEIYEADILNPPDAQEDQAAAKSDDKNTPN